MAESFVANTRPFPKQAGKLVLQLAVDKWQAQLQQVDSLDMKLANFLGLGGILLAIFIGFFASKENVTCLIAYILLAISAVLYIGIWISTLIAFYVKRWEGGPPLDITWNYAREYTEDKLVWWAAERFTKSYENNQAKLKNKVRAFQINIVLIALQLAMTATGLTITALD